MDTREWECVPTDDSTPINLQSHPRNTILGASLLIERLFPECPKEELMQKALDLAVEFNNALEARTKEVIAAFLERKYQLGCGYNDCSSTTDAHLENANTEILKHFGIK